jgi:hypothetical protein
VRIDYKFEAVSNEGRRPEPVDGDLTVGSHLSGTSPYAEAYVVVAVTRHNKSLRLFLPPEEARSLAADLLVEADWIASQLRGG